MTRQPLDYGVRYPNDCGQTHNVLAGPHRPLLYVGIDLPGYCRGS